jgi:hypothetical protein
LPVNFQWLWNGSFGVTQNFANAAVTAAARTGTLLLTNVALAQAGAYTVVASNAAGVTVSLPAQLTVLADNDGDRLPDEWETAHGLRSDDPVDAAVDNDHDGMTNLAEYLAGTNPTNALSVLKLAVESMGAARNPLLLRLYAVSN